MSDDAALYEFVFRGQLTEMALDAAGRAPRYLTEEGYEETALALSLELFDEEYLRLAKRMALVYTAISAFENSVRSFVSKVLLDSKGEEWWQLGVSEKIRKFAESRREEEQKTKWHSVRGDDLLSYTEMGQLVNIIQQNWPDFEVYVRRLDWISAIFGSIERSRNVIMHSGSLDAQDIERLGMNMRDWIKQVGL